MIGGDIIAAIATPPGRGGVGIVRVSGPNLEGLAKNLLNKLPKERFATYSNFVDQDDSIIDQGIALFFKNPHSFTGEDVLELQGHGGPVVMNMLLQRIVSLGARIAKPGEFSERAFLNDKIDLSQAEAIADLIDSVSQQAAKGAVRSLRGEFSKKIHKLNENVISTRVYVEAAIDFPEEEIDFLSDKKLIDGLLSLKEELENTLSQAKEGALLREGLTIVLSGRPNVGKSSLMNQLSGKDSSIVTKLAGTTRDLVNELIHLDGVPIRLIDTAGIRVATDEVEEEGIRRALKEITDADGILLLIDLSLTENWEEEVANTLSELPGNGKVLVVLNKIDLVDEVPKIPEKLDYEVISCSALEGTGIENLRIKLKTLFGLNLSEEGTFVARSRHINALKAALNHVTQGREQLESYQAGELLAEELRLCHECLCEITGEFSSDDLLGEIFSSFCIGK